MRFRFVVAVLTGMAVCGSAVAAGASAAARAHTSVSLQFASQGQFTGRLSASTARCVRGRVVHLQQRKGSRWATVATARSNRAGRFRGAFHTGGGRYRAVAGAKGSCAGGISRTVAAPAGGGGPSTPSAPRQPACSLPLTHDTYDGFHIAVPSGWELFTLGGELTVEKDAAGSEGVIVAPAAQTSGVTPASYFQSESSKLESQAASPITVTGTSSQNGIPTATFTESVGGQTVSGESTVLVEPLAGQAGSTELVFVAYWAPSAAFGSESGLLASVADCYGPETASLYRIYQDAAFTYMLPPGWTVPNGDEGPDSLSLTDPSGDVVAYLLTTSQNLPFNSSQTLIDSFLNAANLANVTKLWSVTSSSGNTEYEEFTATYNGQPAHGVIYGEATGSNGFYSGVVRLGIAPAANWNAVNGALIQMAGFIQHDFTQDLETINQINQQWQEFSNQVSNFDDTLNNQQLTQDPTSGIYYDAPYDSYEVDGPNGPGYYKDDHKLNIINRP